MGKSPIPTIYSEPEFWGTVMRYRTLCTMLLTVPFLGIVSGCDNRPKIVMPTETAPPAPRPHVAGGGAGPAEAAPASVSREKLSYPKELPADANSPRDKE